MKGVDMDTVLLTAVEVASVLRISKAHSYKMIKSGELPSVRFGRSVRVKQEALDAFISKNVSGHDGNDALAAFADVPVLDQAKEVAVH
jgi:excisionase family DNA binding protein